MNTKQLEQIAIEAVAPNVEVNVWEDKIYPSIILTVTVKEEGETTVYENNEYLSDLEEAALADALLRVPLPD